LLERCYSSCLEAAAQVGANTIAFPLISTGAYGYPVAEACKIALSATSESSTRLQLARFVAFDDKSYDALQRFNT
jgi:O-acetyl-ADP-ribose deacetylase (regulator of RNase III)